MNIVLLIILVLGPLIFFHELGHFLIARLFGVGVEKFSLGFGPRLFGKTVGRTDYRISLIPLGGYVKMVGDEPDAELPPEDLPFSFTHKPVGQRSLIVVAGPVANLLLAMLIFTAMVYFAGITSIKPYVRNLTDGSPAATAGVQLDDRLLAVDGTPVASWRDIDRILGGNQGQPVALSIDRAGRTLDVTVQPEAAVAQNVFNEDVTYYTIGISGVAEPPALVGEVREGMPAAEAGLRPGDRIISINGFPIQHWREMQKMVVESEGRELRFEVRRGEQTRFVNIAPMVHKDRDLAGMRTRHYRIGITMAEAIPANDKIEIPVSLLQSVQQGFSLTWRITQSFFEFLEKLFQGKVSREMVGGPLRIAQMAQQSAERGMMDLFFFIAAISLQLAILNLLPIPVLDGGHLMFYAIEVVMRRPLSRRMRETAQQVGLFLLLLLMVFVVYNDIDFTWFK